MGFFDDLFGGTEAKVGRTSTLNPLQEQLFGKIGQESLGQLQNFKPFPGPTQRLNGMKAAFKKNISDSPDLIKELEGMFGCQYIGGKDFDTSFIPAEYYWRALPLLENYLDQIGREKGFI